MYEWFLYFPGLNVRPVCCKPCSCCLVKVWEPVFHRGDLTPISHVKGGSLLTLVVFPFCWKFCLFLLRLGCLRPCCWISGFPGGYDHNSSASSRNQVHIVFLPYNRRVLYSIQLRHRGELVVQPEYSIHLFLLHPGCT